MERSQINPKLKCLIDKGYLEIDGIGTILVIRRNLGYSNGKASTYVSFKPSHQLAELVSADSESLYGKECSTGGTLPTN